jgi:hypothetical protein
VRVVGLKTLPVAGDELIVVDSEARAQLVADLRQRTAQLRYLQQPICCLVTAVEYNTVQRK